LGDGPCARHIAQELLSTGTEIIIAAGDKAYDFHASVDHGSIEILTGAKLLSCKGSVGDFRLVAACGDKKIKRTVANIIIAEENQKEPNFGSYGLVPSPEVASLSKVVGMLRDSSPEKKILLKTKKMVFLTGLAKESNPVIAEEIMRSCLKLQSDWNIRTYILTKNLKVAANGLEALYRETKKAGSVYIKFTDTVPQIHPEKDGGVKIEFTDEITLKKFRLTPDVTVVDENIIPSDNAAYLAGILRLDTDHAGFVQTDNVHRYSVFTNRKGIMVAGSSRSIQSFFDQITDAENAAMAASCPVQSQAAAPEEKAGIDTGQCVRCLTCYRLCPFGAIILNTRVSVVPDACERCGICTVQCPRNAICIKDLEPVTSQIKSGFKTCTQKVFTPFLVAFCCSRSAVPAGELAACMGHKLPGRLNIVEVPCAGSISWDHIFAAFENNADGVLVLTCHEGNCHSERGDIYSQQIVAQITDFFQKIGFEKERLVTRTLASNMGFEFAEIVTCFEKNILKLGPSRLKKDR